MLDLTARSLPELFAGFVQTCDATEMGRIQDSIGQAVARLDAITVEAKHERSLLAAELDPGPLLRTLLRLRHDIVMIGRAAAAPLPASFQQRLGPLLTRVSETAADYLRRSGQALAAQDAPPSLGQAEAALDSCADAFARIRNEGLTRGLPGDTVERIFALGFALEQFRHNFRDLRRCVEEASGRA